MAERIAAIEDALLTALRAANTTIASSNIETRNVPLTEEELKQMIGRAPFIYVEYGGGSPKLGTEAGKLLVKRFVFNVFVASKSLRSGKEGQRGSYDLLDKCFDALDGAVLSDTGWKGVVHWMSEQLFYDSNEGGTIYQQVYAVDGNQ